MQRSRYLVVLVLIVGLFSHSALATCVLGIGNTCGDSSREDSFFSKYIFNTNAPTPNDSFDVFGIGKNVIKPIINAVKNIFTPTPKPENKPTTPTSSSVTKVGDKIKNTDLNGKEATTTFTQVSEVQVGAEDPWYFDLDIIGVNGHQCVGCPQEYPNIPGFDYEFGVSIRNTGNVPADQDFTIEVIGEDLNTKKLYYNEVVHRPGFPVGTGVIPLKLYDIGFNPLERTIDPDFIYTGVFDDEEMNFRLTVKLKNDDREVEPGFVEFQQQTRDCKTTGSGATARTSCTTKTKLVRKVIHAQYSDPITDDETQYDFIIKKLTATIIGGAGLQFVMQ